MKQENLLLVDAYTPGIMNIAHIQDGKLAHLYFELSTNRDKVSSVYLGKVINVVSSLSAYFVDYGAGKNGFLSFASCSRSLNKDDLVIVQVVKNEKDNKGAKLTSILRLESGLASLTIDTLNPDTNNTKFRSSSEGDEGEERELQIIWDLISTKAKTLTSPDFLYRENYLYRILRRARGNVRIVVDGVHEFNRLKQSLKDTHHHIDKYEELLPIFCRFGIDHEIKKASSRTVSLKSGGAIVIDIAEAMVSIDVNSSSCLNRTLEETSLKVNLEAAAEIANQIRLRDLSGIIAIDFIDMHNLNHVYMIEEEFRREIKRDHASIRLSSINEFGVMLLSRQRSNFNLYEVMYQKSSDCIGYGFTPTLNSMVFNIISEIRLSIYSNQNAKTITVECDKNVAQFILNDLRHILYGLEQQASKIIKILINDELRGTFTINPAGEFVAPTEVVKKIQVEKEAPITPPEKVEYRIQIQKIWDLEKYQNNHQYRQHQVPAYLAVDGILLDMGGLR